MDIQKLIDSIPESTIESIADKVGVDTGTVQHVFDVARQELQDGGDLLDAGRDLLDKDKDGDVLDDLGEMASSLLEKRGK